MASKVHVRRCHVCGETAEGVDALVDRCRACGKHLASYYYFDEKLAMNLITEQQAREQYRSSALPLKEYPPLMGISVYWDAGEA